MPDRDHRTFNAAYTAAHNALSARYNGDIAYTAEQIAGRVAALNPAETRACARSSSWRELIVDALTAEAVAVGVRGGRSHVRPLVDEAVGAAATAAQTRHGAVAW